MSDFLHTARLPFRLGCPVWNCAEWGGEVFPVGAPRTQWLHWYSLTFNTVEGNSTFYGLPSLDVARRWADETVDGFRFALKLPQAISHQSRLVGCERELDEFIQFAMVLGEADRLGPSFLQLPPTFGLDCQRDLERFLDRLPEELPWAVELRHPDWFDQSGAETLVNGMLRQRGIDKVLFDSRPLYQSPAEDEIEVASQKRKPKTPVRQTVTGTRPMLRLVGRNRLELVERFVQQWLPIVNHWVEQDLDPYLFTHAPDDGLAPQFARLFWQRYLDQYGDSLDSSFVPESIPKPPQLPKQRGLF